MATRNPAWETDELILALDLYFTINPQTATPADAAVVDLSKVLNALPIHPHKPDAERFRNPNGVRMKLMNFLRFDPTYKGKGLTAGNRKEEDVWKTYAHDRPLLAKVAANIRATTAPAVRHEIESAPPDEDFTAPEGRVLYLLHRSRERDTKLVQKKKASALQLHGTLACEVCAFDFAKFYGPLGEAFIECHHTKPLAQLEVNATTSLADLALVCANCHRMLHRGGKVHTIAELQALVSAQSVVHATPPAVTAAPTTVSPAGQSSLNS